MAATTTYEALVELVRALEAGDQFRIGAEDVAPTMIGSWTDLSLATTLTVTEANIAETPPVATISGTASILGLVDVPTSLSFAPVGEAASGPFALAILISATPETRWSLLPGFALTHPKISFASSSAEVVISAEMSGDVVIGTSQPMTLPITTRVPAYPGEDWVLSGQFTAQPISSDALTRLVGGLTLSDYLPEPLYVLARLGLTSMEMAFTPDAGISYVSLEVAYSDAWSALGIIEVPAGGITLRVLADFGADAASYVELAAQFELAGMPFDVGAHFAPGNFYIWGKQQEGRTAAIGDVFAHFNVQLPAGFPEITVDNLSLLANLSQGQYNFDLMARIDAGSTLKVDELKVSTRVATKPTTAVAADFHGTITIGSGATLFLGASYDGGGSGVTLAGNATNIPIGTLIAYLASEFGISQDQIPEPIRTLNLKKLQTRYNTGSGDFSFSCDGEFAIHDTPVDVTFTVEITHPSSGLAAFLPADAVQGSKGYHATFGGSVTFAGHQFGIHFNTTDASQSIFVADYQHEGDGSVLLADLIAPISEPLAQSVPKDISVDLSVVKFAYLKSKDDTSPQTANHFLFGVELGAKIGLTGIPLIGDKLPSNLQVEFDRLQVAYANPGFDKEQAAAVNKLIPAKVGPIPDEGLPEGVHIASVLRLGDSSQPVSLTIPTRQTEAMEDAPNLPAVRKGDVASASVSLNVQKQFGPVGIRKLGLTYASGRLFATGDLSLDAQILRIGLLDLAIGSRIDRFDPAVRLAGLTISVTQGPVKVSGALYGTIDPLNFNGALQVNLPSLSVGALGGYAQLGPDPSFFMYVSINRPLFGYPFFFVDGLAGGLGFNRDLVLPDIDGVADFPLVSWAKGQDPPGGDPTGDIGSQIERVVDALAQDIPPKLGQYWLAAGIKFSSFNVLDSFALVTVLFGTELKFGLLGLTTASIPPQVGDGIQPLGYVEMALRASFAPATGVVEIEAKLTPASFILDRKCNLTGGFAYYMWFKDNPSGNQDGFHAGDFVVTLGGYHPAFSAPRYFPQVPRLGFKWEVDSHTTIRGGIYFALTPSALMAGGALEAVWQSGNLKAWFTAHADFLLSWKPFHYEASMGLSIGASYKLNLLFTSVTISVHVGVRLRLWGPPFGGSILVDLSVISFTVAIGNQRRPEPGPISWEDFKASFLPRATTHPKLAAASLTAPEPGGYCLASISAGMVKDLSGSKSHPDDPDWVVNSEGLEIVTTSVFPSKSATFTTAATATTSLPVGSTDFGVGPVGMGVDDFDSRHAITLNRIAGGKPDPAFDATKNMQISLVTSNLPAATWGGKLIINPSISDINKMPPNIRGLAVGYRIGARLGEPDHTPLPIDTAILQLENSGTVRFSWLTPEIPTTDPFDPSKAMETFQSTLTSTSRVRADIIAALKSPGLDLDVNADVDVSELARTADSALLHAPVLSYLGERRAS